MARGERTVGETTPELSLAKAKATFSAVVTRVERRRQAVTILRHGVPVAQIVPVAVTAAAKLRGSMAGSGRETGDIVAPVGVEWSAGEE